MLVTIDGKLYAWQNGSYSVSMSKLASSRVTASGKHSRSDNGAWVRKFKITLLCENKVAQLDDNGVSTLGQAKAQRNQLRASFAKKTAVTLITPDNDTVSAYFDGDLVENFRFDVDTESKGMEYVVNVNLIEA